jgi:hypothetical protein
MNKPEKLQETALDYIQILSQTIGPRPAGTPAEKQAMDYIQGIMEAAGYRVTRTPAAFASEMNYSPLYSARAILLIMGGFLLPMTPIPALLLPFINISLPQISRWIMRRRETTESSENLFAAFPGREKINRLIICAHVDTGKMSGITRPFWIKLYYQLLFFGQRIAIFLAMLAIVLLMGIHLPSEIFVAVRLLVLVLGSVWFTLDCIDQLGGMGGNSAGANDNASGVGVAMESAMALTGKPPKNFEVAYLFTGAEETGLHGAEQFATQLDPSHDVVLNLDMVGIGNQLCFVKTDGTINLLHTDKKLNAVIMNADKNARGIGYTVRSGDFAAFIRHGDSYGIAGNALR